MIKWIFTEANGSYKALTETIRSAEDLESVWISFNPKPLFWKNPYWNAKIEYSKNWTKIERSFRNENLAALMGEMAAYHGTDCDVLKR